MNVTAHPAFQAAAAQRRRQLILTPRWTPLIPHPIQALFFWHPARFKANPSGRRSGKTEICLRKGTTRHVTPNKQGGPRRILYAAPTYDQAKQIFWEHLQSLMPEVWKERVNRSEMTIETKWGSYCRVMGFDRPERMEGSIWDDVYVDEIADCKPRCFELNVQPALSTRGREGNCDLIGVPDETGPNQAEYERIWEIGLNWPNPQDICSFHWPSTDILDPAEIEARRASMDEFAFKQEYGGQFTRSGGKALPKFHTVTHVSDHYAEYSPFLPIDWAFDFGSNHMAVLIGQTYRGFVWICDEIPLNESSTDVATLAAIQRCRDRNYDIRRIRIFGDAAGRSAQSNTGRSDYEIMGTLLRGYNVEWRNLYRNPLVKDTLNAVRARVCNARGEIQLHVARRCTQLIEDCKSAPWPSDLRQFHCLAALRYYVYGLFGAASSAYEVSPLGLPDFNATSRREPARGFVSMADANRRQRREDGGTGQNPTR